MKRRSSARLGFLILSLTLLNGCGWGSSGSLSQPPVSPFGAPPWRPAGYYAHPAIRESSGLAVSRRYPGVYWTLNDSGNSPMLYATTPEGKLIRAIPVRGADNRDWEALALDDSGRLWIGDIGNNSRRRNDLCVYVLPEPNPFRDRTVQVTVRYPYRYPKKNVDAEGLFIADGVPHIISKERKRAVLYRFPRLEPNRTQTLIRVGTLKDAVIVTGADRTPDGSRLAVCTYDRLWIYPAAPSLAEQIQQSPWTLKHRFAPEAIALDGHDLVLSSESRNLYRIPAWWYERGLPFPPQDTRPALELLPSTHAEGGSFRAESYREAGIMMDGGYLRFEAEAPGATLTQTFRIPYGDRYRLGIVLTRGPEYGQVEVFLDGEPLGQPYDAYAPQPVPGTLVRLGDRSLTEGDHQIALRLMGKAPETDRYVLGLDSYWIHQSAQYARPYLVLGPFAKPEPFTVNTPLPPERARNLEGTFQGVDGRTIRWQPVDAAPNGKLDLYAALKPTAGAVVAYALTYVYSRKDRPARLMVGSDDQIAVWVNGEEVYRNNVMRRARPDEDVITCTLKAGWNEVLCKVGQNGGDWVLYLRVNDPDGSLRYTRYPDPHVLTTD